MKKISSIFLSAILFFSCTKTTTIAPGSSGTAVMPNVYTNLLNFAGTNGANPYGNLTVSGTVLYGMSSEGGAYGYGNIFSINTNGTGYRDLHDFANMPADGANPVGSLTLYNNVLYGMTTQGGTSGSGTIFSIYTTGVGYKVLCNFGITGNNGSNPYGSLTISNGVMYGMTIEGGLYYDGNIFSISITGAGYKDLYDFNNTTGSQPRGSLLLSGTTLYGMTERGGLDDAGVIFSIGTNGSGFTQLLSFDGTNGYNPWGDLLISGNTLYGMTRAGGSGNSGNIFSISTNGSNYKNLFNFNDTITGSIPSGSLLLIGNTLYGMSSGGGALGYGNIFSIETNGTGYKTLYNFLSASGVQPYGSLVLSGSLLYGTTVNGGTYDDGVVFSYSL